MPARIVGQREDAGRVGLLRLIAKALEPPDLHRTDSLPRYAPWGAVILARVVTYVAWALSVALVILVIGATVLAVGIVTGRVTAVPSIESDLGLGRRPREGVAKRGAPLRVRGLDTQHDPTLAGPHPNREAPWIAAKTADILTRAQRYAVDHYRHRRLVVDVDQSRRHTTRGLLDGGDNGLVRGSNVDSLPGGRAGICRGTQQNGHGSKQVTTHATIWVEGKSGWRVPQHYPRAALLFQRPSDDPLEYCDSLLEDRHVRSVEGA